MRFWLGLLGLGALGVAACDGTQGTLVVRRDASGSSGSGGSSPETTLYVPAENVAWQAKLSGAVDIAEDAELFYLDAELQDSADLAQLHEQGRHYICYLSAGSWEDFRDDAKAFPESALGSPLPNFENERWLDVRSPEVRQLMQQRIERLGALGCDGIPPSSLAVHAADTGLGLTQEDALDYARWLAERIHAAGMSAGLAAPLELTRELWPSFEFGLAIGCLQGSGCAEFAPFVEAHRPVLHIELGDEDAAPGICKMAEALGFEPLVTSASFNGQSVRCRDIL
ncbi:MAG TPA: endo alpha-1,4 polygalactosaminidase [Polyangiaceae bacterium]